MRLQSYGIIIYLAGAILTQTNSLKSQSRLFHYDPKPFYSMRYFPQDALFWEIRGGYLNINHNRRGWLGNLNESFRMPKENYSPPSQSLKTTNPEIDYHVNGYSSNYTLETVPFFNSMGKHHLQIFFGYCRQHYSFESSGTDSWKNKDDKSIIYPFQAQVKRTNSHFSLGCATAFFIAQYPIGIRFAFTIERTGKPRGGLKIGKIPYVLELNRLTWGWAINQNKGDNLLGEKAHIDGFEQNKYYMSESWETNSIIGLSIKQKKFGFQWRHRIDHIAYYEYDFNLDDYYIENNGLNWCTTNSWRFYNLSQLMNFNFGKLALLGLIEYERCAKHQVESELNGFKLRYFQHRTFLKIGPIFYVPYRYAYVTSGLLLWSGLSNFKNLKIIGNTEIFGEGSPQDGWPDQTDKPSYGGAPFVGYSLETNIEILITRNPELRIRAELWRQHRRTYTNLHYGKNETVNDLTEYIETAHRKALTSETWFGGQLGLWYHVGDYFGGLFLDLPVNYHTRAQTELVQTNVGLTFKDHQKYKPLDSEPMQITIILGKQW